MKEELTLEQQVERIRRKRRHYGNHEKLRAALNTIFLLLAAIGFTLYWVSDHRIALGIMAAGMLCKMGEFIVRFFL